MKGKDAPSAMPCRVLRAYSSFMACCAALAVLSGCSGSDAGQPSVSEASAPSSPSARPDVFPVHGKSHRSSGGRPLIVERDLGLILADQSATATFRLKNESGHLWSIRELSATCSCTAAEVTDQSVSATDLNHTYDNGSECPSGG